MRPGPENRHAQRAAESPRPPRAAESPRPGRPASTHLAPRLVLALLAFLVAPACGEPRLLETSAVARVQGRLLLAGDEESAAYFALDVARATGPLIPIHPESLVTVGLPAGARFEDIESMARLADGRLVFLSEEHALLFSPEGVVARYDERCRTVSARGLEGVAVRPGPDGGSVVAVAWEGGYPEDSWPGGGAEARDPFVIVHEVPAGARDLAVAGEPLVLRVPRPGAEPEAQRFRAPGLVWHLRHTAPGDSAWGFIALISSQNAKGPRRYEHHWLQRFTPEGERDGDPLELDTLVPDPALGGRNWEGLDWWEEGRSLVVVYENEPGDTVFYAFVVELPEAWRPH